MTPPVVRLPDHLRAEMVAHCLAEFPNEGCGLLAMDEDQITKVYPTANDARSPVAYTIPPRQHFDALEDAESRGWHLGGAFHSHPTGPPRMSPTDLSKALERDWVYVVVGLDGEGVELGAWCDGEIVELA